MFYHVSEPPIKRSIVLLMLDQLPREETKILRRGRTLLVKRDTYDLGVEALLSDLTQRHGNNYIRQITDSFAL